MIQEVGHKGLWKIFRKKKTRVHSDLMNTPLEGKAEKVEVWPHLQPQGEGLLSEAPDPDHSCTQNTFVVAPSPSHRDTLMES